MHTFIKTKDETNQYDKTEVVVKVVDHDADLNDLLEAFESYLLASGFVFDGHLEISEGRRSLERDFL